MADAPTRTGAAYPLALQPLDPATADGPAPASLDGPRRRSRPAAAGRRPVAPRPAGRAAPAAAIAAAVAVLVVVGVVLRLWFLGHAPLTSDQAVVGLMAQGILHGHLPVFYWGQDYGGVEPYVTAAGVALFGLHPWVIDGTPALLAAVAAVVAWRLGRRLTGSTTAGAVAGALTWGWSEAVVWNSTQEYGFRGVVLVCSLLLALAAAHLVSAARLDRRPTSAALRGPGTGKPARLGPWLLLGAAGGVGWWASPEILYVAVPALAAAVWSAAVGVRRRGARALAAPAAGVAAAALGALPWLVASVHDGFRSLSVAGADQGAGGLGYGGRLQVLLTHTIPMALGARLPMSGTWLGGPVIGGLLLGVAVLVLGAGLVVAARSVPAARVLVAAVVLTPLLGAAMGPTYYWADGRYGVYLPPLAAVAAVAGGYRLVTGLGRRRNAGAADLLPGDLLPGNLLPGNLLPGDPGRPERAPRAPHRPLRLAAAAGVAACALAALSTVAAADAATAVPGDRAATGLASAPLAVTGHPDRVAASVAAALLARHVAAVEADYWVAYVLDVVSGGRLVATPPDIVRDPSLAAAVGRAPDAAWLFVGPTAADAAACAAQFSNPDPQPFGLTAAQFTALLAAHGIASRTVAAGPMVAVVPGAPVPAAWVALQVAHH